MFPLEGVSDYVDITSVVNPWQAMVTIFIIFALLIWPSLSARQSVRRVEKTLTQNNGGSTVKDAMDRIEKVQAEHGRRLDDHVVWSEGFVKETGDRVTALEKRRGPVQPRPLTAS